MTAVGIRHIVSPFLSPAQTLHTMFFFIFWMMRLCIGMVMGLPPGPGGPWRL
jgi:hypothetical protein